MTAELIIAIDGPAASGKSTIAQAIAKSMDYLYFDTGVMYRAVTLAVLRKGVAVSDEAAVSEIAESLDIDVSAPSAEDGRAYTVYLDGEDVTWDLRSPEVEANVSEVSMYRGVRRAMTQRQRDIGLRKRVVMVGRDIGTVVLPEADLKIFLVASVEERAKRRYQESLARGEKVTYEKILASMRTRDELDSTRELAPLLAADDAVTIDTTQMTVEQVVDLVLRLVKEKETGS